MISTNLEFQKKILLARILNKPINDVFNKDYVFSSIEQSEYESKLKLLESGYPLDYLLGQVEFLGQKFLVTPDTLIPRPETEEWVLNLKKDLEKSKNTLDLLVDIGCGSGVIGLSLNKYYKKAFLVDISNKALDVAKKNAQINKIENVSFFESDLLGSAELQLEIKKVHSWLLVANLPYLPSHDESKNLQNNVAFEPEKALYSGVDGLDLFRKLLLQIQSLRLKPEAVYFELDPRNIVVARSLLKQIYTKIEILLDENGLQRVLIGLI